MAIVESLTRLRVGAVTERARVWLHEGTEPREKPHNFIEPVTVTAIENKADLLLGGADARHTGMRSGVYRKISQGANTEITRYIDNTSGEQTRYYNIYYQSAKGTNFVYRSVRESNGSSSVTLNSSQSYKRGEVRQSEGLALLQVMRQAEQVCKKKDTKTKVTTSFKKAASVFEK